MIFRDKVKFAYTFQSTPAIADGRTRLRALSPMDSLKFQSTPAIADGRTWVPPEAAPAPAMFQSTPAIADGRTMPAA